MKITRNLLLLFLALIIPLINISCDDSGVDIPKYAVTFSHQNLKHLNPLVDGVYEVWIGFPPVSGDLSNNVYVSCGRFNIDPVNGGLIDSTGTSTGLKLKYIPSNVNAAIDAILTIEPPNDNDSIPDLVMMGGPAAVGSKLITANLTMKYSGALGLVAENLPNATARYILDTPSDTGRSQFFQGMWFCDTTGSSLMTNMNVIPDSTGWTYEAWVFDKRDSTNYSLGKFTNPNAADNDGAGPFKGPNPGYDKPGQDYVRNAPPGINHFGSWYYGIMITLEPRNEPANSPPFYIKLFYINTVQNIITRGTISDFLPNSAASNMPTAIIQVTK